MRSQFPTLLAMGAALIVLGTAPAVRADETDGAMRIDFPQPHENEALMQWRDQRGWRYSTDYLFGTTRGMEEQNIPVMCRRAAWILTVPFDIANLPFAAAAGLFGD